MVHRFGNAPSTCGLLYNPALMPQRGVALATVDVNLLSRLPGLFALAVCEVNTTCGWTSMRGRTVSRFFVLSQYFMLMTLPCSCCTWRVSRLPLCSSSLRAAVMRSAVFYPALSLYLHPSFSLAHTTVEQVGMVGIAAYCYSRVLDLFVG